MPHYVILGNWTEEGIRSVKNGPKREEAFRKAVDAAGGKIVVALHTMGRYDFVTIVELPSDDAMNLLALRDGQQGFIRTTTLKGWTSPEFAELVGRL